MKIAFVGNGIVANMGALYFRKLLPKDVEIFVIGPADRGGLPLVGESTIEITGNFLEKELGLKEYLQENHLPKYALTYYFKLDPNNPEDRTYSVHGTESLPGDLHPFEQNGKIPQPVSWQINRHTFDPHLEDLVSKNEGIKRILGLVKDIQVDSENGHQLDIMTTDGVASQMTFDWVIDASGRNRFLGNKLNLTIWPEGQRDCFWFRLADFDRSILSNLTALGPKPPEPGQPGHYDRYYSTHHFMGPGNWIWMIPIKAEDDSELMSVGFVSHPDHFSGEVRSMEGFLEYVKTIHPVVSEFVESGRIVDTNLLRRYHYVTSPVYSPDRWAVVGDAAFAPDPLFSNGLAFCVLQLEQIGEILRNDYDKTLTSEFVENLAASFMIPVLSSQTTISEWYPSMNDALLSSMKINWIETIYFYMFLPLVINRCHYDPARLRLWKALQIRDKGNVFDIPREMYDLRRKVGNPIPDHFVYKGREKINPVALKQVQEEKDIYVQLEGGSTILARYFEAVKAKLGD